MVAVHARVVRSARHTTRMSTEASGRFRIPNWSGVKIRSATRF